jgi:hypothetical protein
MRATTKKPTIISSATIKCAVKMVKTDIKQSENS